MTATIRSGVFYSASDYAGPWRRLLIIVIDLVMILLGILANTWVVIAQSPLAHQQPSQLIRREMIPAEMLIGTWLLFLWSYLVLLETYAGTVGFWITGVRIVDLSGKRPSLWRMTFRALLLTLVPFNLVVDWIWLVGDRHRQTLRDKVAGTYVVRRRAAPSGIASLKRGTLMFLMLNLPFEEVRMPAPQ